MALGGGAAEGIQVPIEGDSSGLNDALDGAMGKLGDFKGAVAGVGAALGALATKALADSARAAMDFEQAMANVEKTTDPTTAREMRDEIMNMATEIPLAQEKLADLASQAGRMGAEGTDEVARFTRVAAEMGAATELAAEDAGTALAKLSSALGEPLSEVGKLGDAINEVSNNFATDSEEIVDAAQRSGQVLSNLGMKSDEIIGLAGAMNEVSPTSRIAASRMQAFGEALANPEAVGMFADSLGVTAERFKEMRQENPQDTMMQVLDAVDQGKLSYEDLNATLKTSTARAFRDTASNADTMRQAMETSNKAMSEGGSLAGEVAVETDTAAGQFQLLKNRARNLAIQIGDNLLPYIRDMLAEVTKAVDWFAELNTKTGGLAGTVGLLVTAVGGFVTAGGALVSMMGGMAAVTGTLTAGVTGLTAAFAAISAPILVAVGAVAALAAAFKTDFAGVRTATMRVLGVLQEELQPAITWLQTNGVPIANRLRDAFVSFASTVEPYIRPLVGLIADGLILAIRGLFDVLGAVIPPAIAFLSRFGQQSSGSLGRAQTTFLDLRDTVQAVVARIRAVMAPLLTWLSARWREFNSSVVTEVVATLKHLAGRFVAAGQRIRSILQPLFAFFQEWATAVRNLFGTYFRALRDDLVAVWNALTSTLTAAWRVFGDEIIAYLRFVTDAITGIARTFWEGFLALFKTFMQVLRGDWEGALNTISTFFTDTLNRLHAFAQEWGGRFLGWLSGLVDSIIQWFQDLYTRLVGGSIIPDMFADMLATARSFGSDLLSWLGGMITRFLSNVANLIAEGVRRWANLYVTLYNRASRFGSDLLSWLGSLTSDFLGAVRRFARDVVSKFGSLASDAKSAITDVNFYSAGKSIVGSLVSGIRNKIDDVKDAAGDVASAVDDYMPGSDADTGPLSNLSDFGPEVPGMVADGMTDPRRLRDVQRAAREVARNARPVIEAQAPQAVAAQGRQPVREGDQVDIQVTIQGDADRHEVERGLSRALQAHNIER